MSGERYSTVWETISQGPYWMVVVALKGREVVGEAVDYFIGVFKQSLDRLDDEISNVVLGWLFSAINDVEFVPLLQKGDSGEYYLSRENHVEKAEERAQRRRAEKAMELWPDVVGRRNQREPGKSVLLGTKKTLLIEIARWWRDAPDDAESDRIMRFLVSTQMGGFGFKEDEEALTLIDAIRSVTNGWFAVNRLERQLPAAIASTRYDEISKIIMIGWVRNIRPKDLAIKLSVLEPLIGCSREAHEFLRLSAENTSALDRDAVDLWRFFGKRSEDLYRKVELPEGCQEVPGVLKIGYELPDTVCVHLTIPVELRGREFKDEQGYQWLGAAERNVRRWQEQYRRPAILKIAVGMGYHEGSLERTVFAQERKLVVLL